MTVGLLMWSTPSSQTAVKTEVLLNTSQLTHQLASFLPKRHWSTLVCLLLFNVLFEGYYDGDYVHGIYVALLACDCKHYIAALCH